MLEIVLHFAFKVYKRYRKITTTIKGKRYKLWIADTPKKKKLGLSPLIDLPRGWGMIFNYDTDVDHGFTMEKTKIPLTIIFLDNNFNIVDSFNCRPGQKGSIKPRDGKKYRHVIEI